MEATNREEKLIKEEEQYEAHPACPKCQAQTVVKDAGTEMGCMEHTVEGTTVMECSCRIRHRDEKEYRDLMNRLKRIEGQVRGIQGMVEEERYCVDILTQVMAVQSALNSFNKALLSNHIKTCVVRDIREGNSAVVDELCSTIQKLMK